MTVREIVAFLGFELDDAAVRRFDSELAATRAEVAALSERLRNAEQAAAAALGGMQGQSEGTAASLGQAASAAERLGGSAGSISGSAGAVGTLGQEASGTAEAMADAADAAEMVGAAGGGVERSSRAFGNMRRRASEAGNEIGGIRRRASEAGDRIDWMKKRMDSLAKAANAVGSAFKFAVSLIAIDRFTALGRSILETTGEVEQYRVTLGTMIGDQEKANQIIHDLDYSPVSDFYGTAAAIGGLQGMVTFGMQAEEASEILTRLGDIAQGNGEAFNSLSLNMGQVFAKGKADATDLKQFVGQGFDVVGEVSKMTGRSRAEIEKAGVSYEQCAEALAQITSEGGKYNGMLAKQSRTLPGLVKQFQSLGAAIKESIGTAVLDKVKSLMQHFLDLGRAMQDNIAAMGTKVFDTVLRGIADVIIFFDILQLRMKKFGGAFTSIKALATDMFGFVGSIIRSLQPLVMGIGEAVLLAFKPVQAFVHPVLESLKPIFKDVFQFGADMIEQLLPVIDGLAPVFRYVGDAVAAVLEKIRPIIRHVGDAILAVTAPIKDILFPVIYALEPLVSAIIRLVLDGLDAVASGTSLLSKIIVSVAPLLSVVGKAAGFVVSVLANGLAAVLPVLSPVIKALVPIAGIIMGIVAAVKVWTAVQSVLNVIMSANPVALIIIAVIALIGIIVLLVKHWDKVRAVLTKGAKAVGDFFKKIWNAIKKAAVAAFNEIKNAVLKVLGGIKAAWRTVTEFFSALWDGIISAAKSVWNGLAEFFDRLVEAIKTVWGAVTGFFSSLWGGIISAAEALWNGLADFFIGLVEAIKAAWNTATGFFSSLWDGIVLAAKSVWNGVADFFRSLVGEIKSVWNALAGFFTSLWNGIISSASAIWNGITGVFSSVIGAIKSVWNGITEFFSGLWDALKESPLDALQFIKEAFIGLFNGIKEKFFGFTDTLKEGWEKVKGFFGGIWDGAVNFVTGGGRDKEADEPRKVNDLILTPEGTYSTHPEDTIFAMKEPGRLMDRLAALFAQSVPSPAGTSFREDAVAHAARQTIINDNSRHPSSQVYNAPVHVTVNAGGMSVEQARRAVEGGVRNALRDAIAGSRGTIPSPEARRA